MRVFLDANILFSAAKSDGAIRSLLRLLMDAGHSLYATSYVVMEAERNLSAKAPTALGLLQDLLREVCVSSTHPGAWAHASVPTELADKDRPVIAGAIGLKCDVLLL